MVEVVPDFDDAIDCVYEAHKSCYHNCDGCWWGNSICEYCGFVLDYDSKVAIYNDTHGEIMDSNTFSTNKDCTGLCEL